MHIVKLLIKKTGVQCSNCIPMLNGNCSNKSTLSSQMIDASILPVNTPSKSISLQHIPTLHLSFVDKKMFEAFGAPLTNSEGEIDLDTVMKNFGNELLI